MRGFEYSSNTCSISVRVLETLHHCLCTYARSRLRATRGLNPHLLRPSHSRSAALLAKFQSHGVQIIVVVRQRGRYAQHLRARARVVHPGPAMRCQARSILYFQPRVLVHCSSRRWDFFSCYKGREAGCKDSAAKRCAVQTEYQDDEGVVRGRC